MPLPLPHQEEPQQQAAGADHPQRGEYGRRPGRDQPFLSRFLRGHGARCHREGRPRVRGFLRGVGGWIPCNVTRRRSNYGWFHRTRTAHGNRARERGRLLLVAHMKHCGNEPREQTSAERAAHMTVRVGVAELTVAHLCRRGSSEARANSHNHGCDSNESAAMHLRTLFSHSDCDRDRTPADGRGSSVARDRRVPRISMVPRTNAKKMPMEGKNKTAEEDKLHY